LLSGNFVLSPFPAAPIFTPLFPRAWIFPPRSFHFKVPSLFVLAIILLLIGFLLFPPNPRHLDTFPRNCSNRGLAAPFLPSSNPFCSFGPNPFALRPIRLLIVFLPRLRHCRSPFQIFFFSAGLLFQGFGRNRPSPRAIFDFELSSLTKCNLPPFVDRSLQADNFPFSGDELLMKALSVAWKVLFSSRGAVLRNSRPVLSLRLNNTILSGLESFFSPHFWTQRCGKNLTG